MVWAPIIVEIVLDTIVVTGAVTCAIATESVAGAIDAEIVSVAHAIAVTDTTIAHVFAGAKAITPMSSGHPPGETAGICVTAW